ncbi:hypothetical protein TNCV_4256821 [Trichonephila clavipes]|nr:hypothetical protein TNCV_4256821 [Trichonephila clavipes]
MDGEQKPSDRANCKGQLALTLRGERRLMHFVRSHRSQKLAQIITQLNNDGSRTLTHHSLLSLVRPRRSCRGHGAASPHYTGQDTPLRETLMAKVPVTKHLALRNAQYISNHSDTHPTITVQSIFDIVSQRHVLVGLAGRRAPGVGVIFYSFPPFSEQLVPLKNTRSTYSIIIIGLFNHVFCLFAHFTKLYTKFDDILLLQKRLHDSSGISTVVHSTSNLLSSTAKSRLPIFLSIPNIPLHRTRARTPPFVHSFTQEKNNPTTFRTDPVHTQISIIADY